MVDDQYIDPETGAGIFQYNDAVTPQSVLDHINAKRSLAGLSTISLNSIKCATSDIFNVAITGFSISPFTDPEGNVGKASQFNMKMALGTGEYRCATVLVNKTIKYRQIISRGFASCTTVSSYPIERAIVSTSKSYDITAPADVQ
jgi:hypothetical protein